MALNRIKDALRWRGVRLKPVDVPDPRDKTLAVRRSGIARGWTDTFRSPNEPTIEVEFAWVTRRQFREFELFREPGWTTRDLIGFVLAYRVLIY